MVHVIKHFLHRCTIYQSIYRNIYTSSVKDFRYNKMAVATGDRVLVHLKNKESESFRLGNFTECIIDYIEPENIDGICQGLVELKDNKLYISQTTSSTNKSNIKMIHPSFCPIHNLTDEIKTSIPSDVLSRGIDCGAAVILESGDGKIFLTRRGDHLRTFPGIWVPPGGHIEKNETLHDAGLRELQEETGLTITTNMCQNQTVDMLLVWESVFPPKLTLGVPKRHHAVVYLHAKLKPNFTVDKLMSTVNIDPSEVGACAWFDKTMVEYIVSAKEDGAVKNLPENVLSKTFSAICLDDSKKQYNTMLPFCDLLKTAGDDKDEKGRVSTGTKYALQEWLHKST
ncbi:hydrolase [Mactra antiquata]